VVNLKRVRIINLELGNLQSGQWRKLTPKELKKLFKTIGYDKDISVD
jgi:23S rRNA pseudouridine2604 synthase